MSQTLTPVATAQADRLTTFTACIIGETSLPIQCAEILLEKGHRIACIVSGDPQVERWANEHQVEHQPPSGDLAAGLSRRAFEYLLSIANLQMLPPEVLALAKRWSINFHDGPLPRYAGLNAPSWAILNREGSYAVTWHLMTQRVDAGEVLLERPVEISPDEDALSLNLKCYQAGIESFRQLVDGLAERTLRPQPQRAGKRMLFGRNMRPASACVLDWERPPAELAALVRALSLADYPNPLGSPKAMIGDEPVVVGQLEVLGPSGKDPGTLTGVGEGSLWVSAAGADVALRQFATPDGEPVAVQELVQRHSLAPGVRLPLLGDAAEALRDLQEALAPHEHFWAEQLASLEPTVTPYERSGAPEAEAGFVRTSVQLPTAARQALRELTGATNPADAILVALIAYLGRLTGADRVHVGLSRKPLPDGLSTFDTLFAPALPLRVEVEHERPFAATWATASAAMTAVREHRGYLRDLRCRQPGLRRSPATLPIVLGVLNPDAKPPAGAHLAIWASPDGERLVWEHRTDVLRSDDVQLMQVQLSVFLEDLARKPERPLCELALLSPLEERRLLLEWNATEIAYERGQCVHAAFEAQAVRAPDAVALIAGSRVLTYAELDRRANQLARHLRDRGARPGVRVGLCAERSAEMVIGLLAILKAGAAYVPMDPAFPIKRVQHMVEDARVPIMVSTRAAASNLTDCPATLVLLDGDAGAIAQLSEEPLMEGTSPDSVAYVMYTSGSTGKPKGVQVTHRNVANFFAAMDRRLQHDPPGIWLAVTSISFDISVLELFWTLARGFKVVLYTGDEADSRLERRVRTAVRPVNFSLFYFGASEGQQALAKYRLLMEGARFADANGFAAVWTPERHFHAFGGLYPNPAVLSAAIATITERVAIRAGSCVSPLHNAIRIAEEWSIVDNLSHGRAGVSFASGWHPNDFVLAPASFADRKAMMVRQIDMVRRLWRGESVWAPGPNGDDVEVRILPHPIQSELPVWITSAGSPDTFRLAGEMGCNVLTHLLGQSVEDVQHKLEIYREAWQQAGRGPGRGHVTLMLHAFVGDQDDAVKEQVRRPMKDYLRSSVGLIQAAAWSFPAFKTATTDSDGRFALDHLSPQDLDRVLDFSFERYYETSGLLGAPKKCLQLVETMREIGVDEIACLIDFMDDTDLVLKQLPHLDQVRERASRSAHADGPEARHPIAWLIEGQGVTHLQCTPSMATMLLASPGCRQALGRLRQLMIGGEAFPIGLARELRQAVAGSIVNMYGPTETTIWSSTHELGPDLGDSVETIPIGRPIGNTTFYILDSRMRPVPTGVAGELYIGGDGVTDGYLDQPELNQARFLADPFRQQPSGHIYRTGDLARYREDGVVEYLGRIDNQVKLRGYRIELGEIESVLSTHPEVRENAVVVRGEGVGGDRLVAYVVAAPNASPAAQELRHYLQERLPDYMVPAAFVQMAGLPLTHNQKIDRLALPEPEGRPDAGSVAAPRDELERELVKIWEGELKVHPVGIDENFFELGGNSLLAVQLFNQIERALGERLPLPTLFRAPTIAQLAEVLRGTEVPA